MELSPFAQAARERDILARHPPPGRMVDIGGRRLHLMVAGPPHGPTVIIEGGGCGAAIWYREMQAVVAPVARVCVYDRAGIGWSDPAPLPRSLADRVDDLQALLNTAGLPPPYILLGHSFGGLLVRLLAARYPALVAGLILADPSNERTHGTPTRRDQLLRSAAAFDAFIATLAAGGEVSELRNPSGPSEQEIMQRECVLRAGQDELRALADVGAEFARSGAPGALGDLPLLVISRGRARPGADPVEERAWREAHRWLATLSTRSLHLIAEECGHNFERPALFRLAVEKIMAMMSDANAVVPAREPGQPIEEWRV